MVTRVRNEHTKLKHKHLMHKDPEPMYERCLCTFSLKHIILEYFIYTLEQIKISNPPKTIKKYRLPNQTQNKNIERQNIHYVELIHTTLLKNTFTSKSLKYRSLKKFFIYF